MALVTWMQIRNCANAQSCYAICLCKPVVVQGKSNQSGGMLEGSRIEYQLTKPVMNPTAMPVCGLEMKLWK